jgi:hypothetical protein
VLSKRQPPVRLTRGAELPPAERRSTQDAGRDVSFQVQAEIMRGSHFEVMGLGAVLGRTIGSANDGPGAEPVRTARVRYIAHATPARSVVVQLSAPAT